ncbi:InlB B-repeat-containing protein [Alishewanella longhuensis]
MNCEQASFVVDAGTLLQFKASAAVGSDFVGWVGACNDDSNCTVEPNTGLTLTAKFMLKQLNLNYNVTTGGVVQKNVATNYYGELVTFTLIPDEGYRVIRSVQGDCPVGQWA